MNQVRCSAIKAAGSGKSAFPVAGFPKDSNYFSLAYREIDLTQGHHRKRAARSVTRTQPVDSEQSGDVVEG